MITPDPRDHGKRIQEALEAPMPERSIDDWVESIGYGWQPLIRGLDDNLRDLDPDYSIQQIKEKFGGLRYYFVSTLENKSAMNELVRAAEDLSFKICEDCGAPGKTSASNGFWFKTLCPLCIKLRQEEKEFKEMIEGEDYTIEEGED